MAGHESLGFLGHEAVLAAVCGKQKKQPACANRDLAPLHIPNLECFFATGSA